MVFIIIIIIIIIIIVIFYGDNNYYNNDVALKLVGWERRLELIDALLLLSVVFLACISISLSTNLAVELRYNQVTVLIAFVG